MLTEDPGPSFFDKTESEMAKGRSLCVRMNDSGLADEGCSAVRQKHFDYGINWKFRRAGTQEAAETYVLGRGVHVDEFAELVRAAELERNAQTYADFGSRNEAADFGQLGKASTQRGEVDGFLEVGESTKLLAVILGLPAGLAADDDDGDFLRVTETGESLKEFIA